LLNQGNHDKAIEMFKLNTQRHPKSANAWDSLGEGYAIKGDKKNAIANFKKSLSMNPPANVKANSEKYLKQLGAL
jgi:tetratricopeptide (TPR) repeat protein